MATDDDTLRRLYVDEGLTIRQVAKKIDVSYETARQRLLNAGIELRAAATTPSELSEEEVEPHIAKISRIVKQQQQLNDRLEQAVSDAIVANVPWKYIAQALGTTISSAHQRFRRLGD